jgi:hypothetical protein
MESDTGSIEARLRRLEDQIGIYQVINGYGYSVDGLNAQAVGEVMWRRVSTPWVT